MLLWPYVIALRKKNFSPPPPSIFRFFCFFFEYSRYIDIGHMYTQVITYGESESIVILGLFPSSKKFYMYTQVILYGESKSSVIFEVLSSSKIFFTVKYTLTQAKSIYFNGFSTFLAAFYMFLQVFLTPELEFLIVRITSFKSYTWYHII